MNGQPRLPNHYELQQCLVKDALNEVWKAFDTQRHLYVAINIIHFPVLDGQDVTSRFLRETRLLTTLQHPHIAPILAAQLIPGDSTGSKRDAFIVMEYVDGLSLADYLRTQFSSQKVPSPSDIIAIFAPICAALDYAHQQGVIHGLLKPSSIMLDKHGASDRPLGEPKLVGFGMHNTLDIRALPRKDVPYIAPEVLQGNTDNVRSDLYTLGVLLYEMCTGQLPFQGQTTVELISQVSHAMPSSPAALNAGLGPELTAVIMRALSRNPVARFSSAWAMLAAVARAMNVSLQGVLRPDIFAGHAADDKVDTQHSPTYFSPLAHSSDLAQQAASASLAGRSNPLHTPTQLAPTMTPVGSGQFQSSLTGLPTVLSPNSSSSYPPPEQPGREFVGAYNQTPAQPPVPPQRGRGPSRALVLVLAALVVLIVVGSLATWFLYLRPTPSTLPGHAYFISSGLVDTASNNGITDRLRLDLQDVAPPQAGNAYYVWLLSDTNDANETLPVLLGTLKFKDEHATLDYAGDQTNTNLLSKYSRLLITEEGTSIQPANPSLQPSTRRYAAEIPRGPNPEDTANHFSLLDHIRHLLAQDPKLKAVNIVGGLDTWLFRNTLKLMEWSGGARDAVIRGDVQLARRQIVRMLDYLLGSQYVQTAGIPSDLPTMLADPLISRVALLTVSDQQSPPGYLKHIGNHLQEIITSPGVSDQQKQLAVSIHDNINDVQNWLGQVRDQALALIKMTPDQLRSGDALTRLNDMATQARNAFIGKIDPNTNQLEKGVAQIHYDVQNLATLEVHPCGGQNLVDLCLQS